MTAYIELREVDMNADMNTLMALMSMMNKPPSQDGGNPMQTMLPLIMGMMGGRGAENAGADGGALGGNAMLKMLPMLMNMMRGGNPFPAGGADGGQSSGEGRQQNGDRRDGENGARPFAAEDGRASPRAQERAKPPYARTPFSEIGFAGAEVRGFMETLWRIRRNV